MYINDNKQYNFNMKDKKKQKQAYKYDILPVRLHKGNEYLKEKLNDLAASIGKSRNELMNDILVKYCN